MTPECYLTFIMDATITGIEKVVKDEITTSIEKALKTKIHLPPTLTIYETELANTDTFYQDLDKIHGISGQLKPHNLSSDQNYMLSKTLKTPTR